MAHNLTALAPEFTLEQATKAQRGEEMHLYSSTSALDGVGGQGLALATLAPRKRHGTRCIGGWVGPRAGLDRCGKISPPPRFDPRTVQPVASRYPGPPLAAEFTIAQTTMSQRGRRCNSTLPSTTALDGVGC